MSRTRNGINWSCWSAYHSEAVAALTAVLLLGTAFAQHQSGTKAAEYNPIVDAQFRPNGRVQIIFKNGERIEPPPEKGQTDCSDVQIAQEGKAAGWLVAYGNYGNSYPIPTSLIVYRLGKPARRFGNGLMLIEWEFADGDKHVQFSSSTVHGSNIVVKELWDIETGRRVKKWTEEQAARKPSASRSTEPSTKV